MNSQEIAQTIIKQMGGFGRLSAMVGASNFVSLKSGVQFSFKGSTKANKCVVKYIQEGSIVEQDTYTFELWKIKRNGDCKQVYSLNMVYCDMLKGLFEGQTGLYLSL